MTIASVVVRVKRNALFRAFWKVTINTLLTRMSASIADPVPKFARLMRRIPDKLSFLVVTGRPTGPFFNLAICDGRTGDTSLSALSYIRQQDKGRLRQEMTVHTFL
jgi:hypothetical protein